MEHYWKHSELKTRGSVAEGKKGQKALVQLENLDQVLQFVMVKQGLQIKQLRNIFQKDEVYIQKSRFIDKLISVIYIYIYFI
jgi:hypothetical protein